MTAAPLRPGTVIDGYEVIDLLGRGGMGSVYRVRRGDTDYALKTLAIEADEESEEVLRFRREAELLGRLRHPGLVRVSAAGNKPGFFYFIMRLVEGESLEARLRRTGPLPEDEAVRIGLAVADAVAHAHERGVVHRDLKPANVLMERDGDRPVVTDFGLGRRLGESEADRLTRTGEILGTPSFVAPEQAFGLKAELDEKTDVYGLGALLYTLLAGHPPFDGPSALMVLKKVSTEPPPPLPDVSPALEAFVLRAMAKRREDRPPSARAFEEELRAVTAASPLVSKPVLALVAFALLLLAGTVFGLSTWRSHVAGLARRVAALRAAQASDPLPAARAAAAASLADVPALVRRGFARERGESARRALAKESWAEAHDAALECWLAAPETPEDAEAVLAASLAELAVAREQDDQDAPGAGKLRELARTASPPAQLAARDALCELMRARTRELVAAVSTSAPAWSAILRHADAARHATASELLPDDCEQARLAALFVAGRTTDLSLLASRGADALRASPLALAARVLYAEALARPDEEARRDALVRLEKIPPPPPYDEVVSELWWGVVHTSYAQIRGSLTETVTRAYAEVLDSKRSDKIAQGVDRLLGYCSAVFVPLGRALRAKPDREPFPAELGEFASFVRLLANQNLLTGRSFEEAWLRAIEPLGEHPIALYIRGRLLANHTFQPRAKWDAARLEELHRLAKALLPRLQHAPRTEHVRALALHFAEKVIFDDAPPGEKLPAPQPGAVEEALPFVELAGYEEAFSALALIYEAKGDKGGFDAAWQRALQLKDAGQTFPDYLAQATRFISHQAAERPEGR